MNEGAIRQPDVVNLSEYLRKLTDEGVSIVSSNAADLHGGTELTSRLVALSDALARELPWKAPTLQLEAAAWAVKMFYHISRFVACRDIGEAEIVKVLAEPCPMPRNPDTDWSVDLLFRSLPEVFRTARHLANADPLVRELRTLATEWPLSSVGIPDLAELKIDSFIWHSGLRQLYVDRILETGDATRLNDPRVVETVRETIGAYPELNSVIAAKISSPPTSLVTSP